MTVMCMSVLAATAPPIMRRRSGSSPTPKSQRFRSLSSDGPHRPLVHRIAARVFAIELLADHIPKRGPHLRRGGRKEECAYFGAHQIWLSTFCASFRAASCVFGSEGN